MFIETEKGVRIRVHDLNPGSGSRPVMFVHGWPLNHRMYEYQFNVLPAYGFRCVGIDLRGFGESDKPWHGYTYDRLGDDVAAVAEALDLQDAALVGFSIGGPISIRYLARHPAHQGSRIRKLVLIDPAAPAFARKPDNPYGMPVEQIDDLIRQTAADRPKMLQDVSLQFFNRNVGPGMLNWFVSMGMQAASYATIQFLVALRDEDVTNDLRAIRVPTSIFHGVHDKIVAYPVAQRLQQNLPGSTLQPLYNSGHGSVVDEMEAMNAALLSALR
ncbi:alpha/beta hydrolase [Paenibacillus sp.]|uniref:alpha/beta fold hydrolase n=1 Tax=Paenibacillus sp. TaxID=58172 RepID=UPI002810D958|nr:alpha/beta hydrolase [Paenibacillus sp.]